MIKTINCIECPKGCEISVEIDGGVIKNITGNSCKRGFNYATDEITCPRRVITSTVKTKDGRVVSVKTERPVKKSEIFDVMKKINGITLSKSVNIGDVVEENISEDINLIATNHIDVK